MAFLHEDRTRKPSTLEKRGEFPHWLNTIEREDAGFSHPARFTLVGTMNPEEGELRPRLVLFFSYDLGVKEPFRYLCTMLEIRVWYGMPSSIAFI